MLRWSWIVLLGALVALALLLAWADSTLFRPLFPHPVGAPRRSLGRQPVLPALAVAGPPAPRGVPSILFALGPVKGLFSFWWFLSTGAGVIMLELATLAFVPVRGRRAAQRLASRSLALRELPQMLAAGLAAILLGLAVTVMMRSSFVLLTFVPLVWAAAALGSQFGVAVLALALGRWLRNRLGSAPALVVALAGLLILYDAALVPLVGWVVLLLLGVAGLGLALLTRFGSEKGWDLSVLDWP